MMNPELKTNWIAALRSGDYTQTTSAIKDERGHCCLGVLAELIDPTGFKVTIDSVQDWRGGIDLGEHADEIGLPRDEMMRLMNLNDSERKSFVEIADYIENSKDI